MHGLPERCRVGSRGHISSNVTTPGRRKRPAHGGLMARPMHVYTIDYVATLIGENLELIQEVSTMAR
ncbi:hypothetical protein [Rhizobium etli]|uniref:hypothetical protein n=1 Tax=Rhizobium etli TaxID=29449 RepID=UPI0003839E66|nr:hypothetical protein REMIM1_PE00267 [Rhizobium etli bv. mimosae str. Mim1]